MDKLIINGTMAAIRAASGVEVIPTLLTGGGFSVIVAIVVGLFAWSNSKSSAAKSIAEGASEFVELARSEAAAAREDAKEIRKAVQPLVEAVGVIVSRVDVNMTADGEVVLTMTESEFTKVSKSLREARLHIL